MEKAKGSPNYQALATSNQHRLFSTFAMPIHGLSAPFVFAILAFGRSTLFTSNIPVSWSSAWFVFSISMLAIPRFGVYTLSIFLASASFILVSKFFTLFAPSISAST